MNRSPQDRKPNWWLIVGWLLAIAFCAAGAMPSNHQEAHQ